MDDLRDRFASLDRVPVPDVWTDVERRLEVLGATAPSRHLVAVRPEWRGAGRDGSRGQSDGRPTVRLLIAVALSAVLIGSAIAVGSGLVRLPAVVLPAPSAQPPVSDTPSPSQGEATPSAATPRPSPSGLLGGGAILAHSWTRTYDRGPYDVFAIDPGTGAETLLGKLPSGPAGGYRFQRSADRTHVLVVDWNATGALSLTAPTEASRALGFIDGSRITNDDCCKGGSMESMVLSPRGDRIAIVHHDGFDASIEVVIFDVNGGVVKRLPQPQGVSEIGPLSWAPDESALATSGCRPCNKAQSPTERQTAHHSHLYIIPLDGSPWREFLDINNGDVAPTWSPAGRTLATGTSICPSGSFEPRCDPAVTKTSLGIANVADGVPITFAHILGYFDIAWSPDGGRIAYRVKNGIYEASADGSDSVKLAQPKGDETGVDWSPDGQWLLFPRDPSELWVMPAAGGEPRRIGTTYAGAAW